MDATDFASPPSPPRSILLAPFKEALCIIDEVIDLSHSIRINLHQCKRLVDFYTRARSYFREVQRCGVFVQAQLCDNVVGALDQGRCLINGYVEANWLKSMEKTGLNQNAFARTHVKLEDSCQVICKNIGASMKSYLKGLYHLLEFDTLAPLYLLDDEYRATLFERDAQMDKKHMLEIITRLGYQSRYMIERIEATTITTDVLRAALDREHGVVAEALRKNKEAKLVTLVKKQETEVLQARKLQPKELRAKELQVRELQLLKTKKLLERFLNTPRPSKEVVNKQLASSSSTARLHLLQDFRISASEIRIGSRIGSGGFATVHKCQWQNHYYAVKMFKATDVEELKIEVQNLVLLPRHPNVVLLVGFSIRETSTDAHPMLLMELLDGDLHTLVCTGEEALETGDSHILVCKGEEALQTKKRHRLKNRMSRLFGRGKSGLSTPKSGLSTPTKIDFIYQIAQGMQFLHNRKVFHGDLKAKNVLVKQRPGDSIQLKITDFGLSEKLVLERPICNTGDLDEDLDCSTFSDHSSLGVRVIDKEGNAQRVVFGNVGTTRWMAPEVYGVSNTTDMKPFSMKADVYSFAMTCVEILTGQQPFPHIKFTRDVKEQVKIGKRPDLSTLKNEFPEPLLSLVERCWDAEPSSRPNFSEIYSSMQKLKDAFPTKEAFTEMQQEAEFVFP